MFLHVGVEQEKKNGENTRSGPWIHRAPSQPPRYWFRVFPFSYPWQDLSTISYLLESRSVLLFTITEKLTHGPLSFLFCLLNSKLVHFLSSSPHKELLLEECVHSLFLTVIILIVHSYIALSIFHTLSNIP